ncbi:MAG: hypothetical protein B7Y99_05610 [Caulobacterales bacterium 32-69-10]|nr:MAG: hypothetical protein B7Y99_05610 [Caulobacterales bacterium 32-69-10]
MRIVTLAAAAALLAGSALAQEPAPAAPAVPDAAAAPAPPPSAAAAAYRPIAPVGDLAATLKASGQFTKFLAAADKAGLTPLLSGARPLTLFVPTDAAIEGTPLANIDAMTGADLQPVLLYHVYGNKIAPDQIVGKKGPVPTAANKNIEIDGSATPNKINDSVILQSNVEVSNGVIYALDKPLTPPA